MRSYLVVGAGVGAPAHVQGIDDPPLGIEPEVLHEYREIVLGAVDENLLTLSFEGAQGRGWVHPVAVNNGLHVRPDNGHSPDSIPAGGYAEVPLQVQGDPG